MGSRAAIVSCSDTYGEDFKILGVCFDAMLTMERAISKGSALPADPLKEAPL